MGRFVVFARFPLPAIPVNMPVLPTIRGWGNFLLKTERQAIGIVTDQPQALYQPMPWSSQPAWIRFCRSSSLPVKW